MKFETLQLHAGQPVDSDTKSRAVPIYQTTSYMFDNCAHAEDLFALKASGNIYTRMMNPTTDVFEKRMAALESGVAALATSSGQAAITLAILNLAESGDEIIAASTLYGGTYNLFDVTLRRLGINTIFVNPDDINAFEKAITKKTKAIFTETISNPVNNIIDIEAVGAIAKKHNIVYIVDNTFGSPYLINPIKHGANVVMHSATKFIGGHGTSIGGVLIEGGNFDFLSAKERYPHLTTPDVSYHGVNYATDAKACPFITKARVTLLRDTGACISPFNSFLLLQGLETLSLRIERHIYNTAKIVDFLSAHKKVEYVNYPNLKGNKYYNLAQKYFKTGAGSIFTFGVKGGADNAKKVIDKLKIFSLLANVADAKSLVIHPGSTTHQQLNNAAKLACGVTDNMIRVSVGLEHIDDLIADLNQALDVI